MRSETPAFLIKEEIGEEELKAKAEYEQAFACQLRVQQELEIIQKATEDLRLKWSKLRTGRIARNWF